MPRNNTTEPREKKPKSDRYPGYLLGKRIGTVISHTSWVDIDERDTMFVFCGLRRNLLGKSAFPDFKDGQDLAFELWSGWAKQFTPDTNDPKFDDGPEIEVNWRVF